jgi:hypothetical protein
VNVPTSGPRHPAAAPSRGASARRDDQGTRRA